MRFQDETSGGYDDEGAKELCRASWCMGSNDDGREPEPALCTVSAGIAGVKGDVRGWNIAIWPGRVAERRRCRRLWIRSLWVRRENGRRGRQRKGVMGRRHGLSPARVLGRTREKGCEPAHGERAAVKVPEQKLELSVRDGVENSKTAPASSSSSSSLATMW